MFEKEAKEYREEWQNKGYYFVSQEMEQIELDDIVDATFKDGAEFGYNKANEWHFVKDGDLPEVDNRIVLCVCGDGYIDGKKHYILKLLTRKEFPLFQPVYAWKEIVLPELEG